MKTFLRIAALAACAFPVLYAQAPAPAPLADLHVPDGFTISVFAFDLQGARYMAVSPEGTLLVARRSRNEVVALEDKDRDGKAEPQVVLSNMTNAHSLAFKDGWLYVATTPAVMRVKWANGKPIGEPEKVVDLPTSTPSVHVTRTIRFGPDGRLYVSIGSSCNACVEPDPRRTTIQVVTSDGTLEPYARGLHNALGFDWDPQTGRMWANETGPEGMGDETPPDEINLIEQGKHYGFPFFVGANVSTRVLPEMKDITPDVSEDAVVKPVLELPAHITGLDLRFYTGTQFPAPYRNALFMTMHGASTLPAPKRIGYKVVRVLMKNGRPTGLEDFATGWLKDGVVSGRPAGLMTGADGALYVSDDNKGFIYRIAYGGGSQGEPQEQSIMR